MQLQTLPGEKYEIILADSTSSDETQAIAKRRGVSVLECPAGKLTARHLAILSTKSSIIVAADADTYYPPSWLSTITAPLLKKKPSSNTPIGVTGPRMYIEDQYSKVSALAFNAATSALGAKMYRFYGSNSAFLRTSYFKAGGFDLSTNQKDSHAMVYEEEVLFMKRLEAFGDIEYQENNPVFTSMRRFSHADKKFDSERDAAARF